MNVDIQKANNLVNAVVSTMQSSGQQIHGVVNPEESILHSGVQQPQTSMQSSVPDKINIFKIPSSHGAETASMFCFSQK